MRRLIFLSLPLLALAVTGFCQTSPSKAATASPNPFDGWWIGKTSQGFELKFEVKGSRVVTAEGAYSIKDCLPKDPLAARPHEMHKWGSNSGFTQVDVSTHAVEIRDEATPLTATKISVDFAPGKATAKLILEPAPWHGMESPLKEACDLGTWEGTRVSAAAHQRAESAKWKTYLTVGTASEDCATFTPLKAPIVLGKGTQSIGYRLGWIGPRPLVQVTGPWGGSNWTSVSCSLPSGSTVTIVSRADGKPLPPGSYVIDAGGTKVRVTVK